MRTKSKVIFALAILLVLVPFVDYGIAELLLKDVPDVPVIVGTPVTYGLYFPKTYAILEAQWEGEIIWKAGYTLHVRTEEDLDLPVVYDSRPKIEELMKNRSAEIGRILEDVKSKKGSWNGSELYRQLSHVVYLNESITEYWSRFNEASVQLFPVASPGWVLLQALIIPLAGIAFAVEIMDFSKREPTKAFIVAVVFSALLMLGYAFVFTGYPFHTRPSSFPDGFLAGIEVHERDSTVGPPCLEDWYVRATPEVEKVFRKYLENNPPIRAEDPNHSVYEMELWLNESERTSLLSELEDLNAVWVRGEECWDTARMRTLNETERLGKRLLERGYIAESDYRALKEEIDSRREELKERKFPAKYRVWVTFVAG